MMLPLPVKSVTVASGLLKGILEPKQSVTAGILGGASYLPWQSSVLGNMIYGSYSSGQIIATSHDLTPNGGLVREIPLF